jgi:glycosyltransferase involved in cell wall biosynthesis
VTAGRRVAVVTSSPPFSEGGHLVIARALVQALEAAGHTASLVVTPQNRFGRQGAAYAATWLTDVGMTADGAAIDQVISLRFPSYAVRHDAHVCWLNHTMREYYDLWDRFQAPLSWRGKLKERARRRLIHAADRYLLTRNVTRVVAQSRTVQARLRRWTGLDAEVVYPPAPPRAYRSEAYGDYIFTVSRLTPLKRVDLLLAALARPEARGVRCAIAGDGEDAPRLAAMIERLGLAERVRLLGRIGDGELVEHLACCRAVCFAPLAEDYGFVTVEAFASARPVVTCHDAGGPVELVDATRGIVCDPEPASLAAALRRLMDDRALAERLGSAARAFADSMSWDDAVARLLIV